MLVEDYYYSIDCNFVQMFSLFAQQIVMQDHANMVMQGTLFPLRLIFKLDFIVVNVCDSLLLAKLA